jgi:hypothetical protein
MEAREAETRADDRSKRARSGGEGRRDVAEEDAVCPERRTSSRLLFEFKIIPAPVCRSFLIAA